MGLPIGAPSPSRLLSSSSSFDSLSDSAMASGVKLSDAVKHAYDDIKKHQKYLYAIFVIKDGEILVEKTVTKQDGSYETFSIGELITHSQNCDKKNDRNL